MNTPDLSIQPPAAANFYLEEQSVLHTNKFILLCIVTGGLYSVWWQYKVWRFFKQWQQSDIWPAARAIFSVFTVYGLLQEIRRFAVSRSVLADYNSGNLTAGYVIFAFLARLPDPLWLIGIGSFTCLVKPQQVFTEALLASAEVSVVRQQGFSNRQLFLLIAFGLLWLLIIWGWILSV